MVGSAVAWPFAARAQQPDRKRRIGVRVDAFGRKAGELIWRAVSIPKPTLLQTEVGSTERQPSYQRTSLLDMINHVPRSDRLTLLATAAASTSLLIAGAAFLDF